LGIEYAIAAAVVSSFASAGVAYQGAQQQGAMGKAQARAAQQNAQLQLEMTRTQSASLVNQTEMAGLEAREQETERRRRAMGADDSNSALAAFAGIGGESGSVLTLAAENRRMMSQDVGAIRLLGQSRTVALFGEQAGSAAQQFGLSQRDRFARGDEAAFGAMQSNAWVRPTLSLLGKGAETYLSGGFSGAGGSKASKRNDTNSMFGDLR